MTTRAAAATIGVLDTDGLHLSERPLVPIRGAISHVGDLYNGARRHGLTQLWLTDAWVRAAGLPADLDAGGRFHEVQHPFMSDGLDALHAFPAALAPWLDLRRKGEAGSSMSLVFPLYDEHGVWGRATEGAVLAAALAAYAAAVGVPYYRSAGRTGLDLLQAHETRRRTGVRAFEGDPPEPARDADTVKELSWVRTLGLEERARRYLHSYDKNATWLGAAGVVELGVGGREERRDAGGVAFDKRLPGYWHARIGGEERWCCTPTVAWAVERGQSVAIDHAYVWTEHSRGLETWYKGLRQARLALQEDERAGGRLALGALKLTYAQAISSFNSAWMKDKGSPFYRPDWRHLVVAQANANLSRALHKMEAAGYAPVAVHKDAVYLVSDEEDAVAAAPSSLTLGTGLGDFKVQDAGVPLEAVLSAFEMGRGGIGTLTRLLRAARR